MALGRSKRIAIDFAPQHRARAPRYPSYRDPRPTDVGARDESLITAAARRFAVYALGLSLPSAAATAQAGSRQPPAKVDNPFSLQNGGFPIHPIYFGTGQPARLTDAEARPIIERVFRSAGVTLKRDVDPRLKGVVVTLDGWNAQRKIGYEFVSWNDYEYAQSRVKSSPEGLSLAELKTLDKLAAAGVAYVAPINHRRYPYGNFAVYSDQRYRAKAKQLSATRDPTRRKQLQGELQTLAQKIAAEGKTIATRKLEADMRQFIRWLRSQGAL